MKKTEKMKEKKEVKKKSNYNPYYYTSDVTMKNLIGRERSINSQ